jgi:hypothetical protein
LCREWLRGKSRADSAGDHPGAVYAQLREISRNVGSDWRFTIAAIDK